MTATHWIIQFWIFGYLRIICLSRCDLLTTCDEYHPAFESYSFVDNKLANVEKEIRYNFIEADRGIFTNNFHFYVPWISNKRQYISLSIIIIKQRNDLCILNIFNILLLTFEINVHDINLMQTIKSMEFEIV